MRTNLNLNDFIKKLKDSGLNPKIKSPITNYYQDFIQVKGQTPRDLFLYPIKNKTLDKINEDFTNLISVLNKFTYFVIYKNNKILKHLNLTGLDIEGIKKRSPDFLFSYGRIDTIFNGQTYKVIEVNTRRPQIYEDTDWLSFYMHNFLKTSLIPEHNSADIMDSINTGYQLNQNKNPETIVLISSFVKLLETKPYKSYFHQALKNKFPKSKIYTFSCPDINNFFEALSIRQNHLYFENNHIDLIILQEFCPLEYSFYYSNGKIKNELIRQAYHNKNLEVHNPPSSWIMGNKLTLSFINDNDLSKNLNLTQKEIESLRLLTKDKTIESPDEINTIDKDKYVIKKPTVSGGKGVYIGSKLSENKLYSIVENYLDSHEELIIQKKINFDIDNIIDLSNFQKIKAALTLDPFIINHPQKNKPIFVSGYSTRAINHQDIISYPKFNPMEDDPKIKFGGVIGYG